MKIFGTKGKLIILIPKAGKVKKNNLTRQVKLV